MSYALDLPAPDGAPEAYRRFTVEDWGRFRGDLPLELSPAELEKLQGVNDPVDMAEVERVYLPLLGLLSVYAESFRELNARQARYLGIPDGRRPFVIGMAGSVAVGKSTTARILQRLLARWPGHRRVDLVTTDGFLLPNAHLEAQGLLSRKGFPESYDRTALLSFLADVKSGKPNVRVPVYSHLTYDRVPDRYVEVDRPDILIVEGLNVLQSARPKPGESHVFVSDYFDFSIFLDADEATIEDWYITRFLKLQRTAFTDPRSYFRKYAHLSQEEAVARARQIWTEINLKNLHENILPTRERAKLILRKGADHRIGEIFLRTT